MFSRCIVVAAVLIFSSSFAVSQVVTFRLEATDLAGEPIDSITVGEEFILQTYTQQVGGFAGDPEDGGVFAGYLDITYDSDLAAVTGEINHATLMSNGKSGDLSAGFMDNIGGFGSSEDPLAIPVPPGPGESPLFSVPMQATAVGNLTFTGSESLEYPVYDVLVYGLDVPVPARDIDFGSADVRIDFGSLSLSVQPVPEPTGLALGAIGVFALLAIRRAM